MKNFKLVLSIALAGGFAFGAFILAGRAAWALTHSDYVAYAAAILAALLVFGLLIRFFVTKGQVSNLVNFLGGVPSIEESGFYEKADAELQSGNMDKAVWAKALVTAKGNEEHRRADYIKLRVRQLKAHQHSLARRSI
ncbi:hypothetical protein EAH72_33390 [Pseudomonas caspiana]|nr:hypothetical protein [Pseudomonas caspiana]TPG88254.1 hypothetical protein EAH72_33390 [Pseudomonas caspiana]